jgi:hypothetical protein
MFKCIAEMLRLGNHPVCASRRHTLLTKAATTTDYNVAFRNLVRKKAFRLDRADLAFDLSWE